MKNKRKDSLIYLIFLLGVLIFSIYSLNNVQSKGIDQNNDFIYRIASDVEPNNNFTQAYEVYNYDNWTGTFDEHGSDPCDYYKIYLQNSDILTIKLNIYPDFEFYFQVYNTTFQVIFHTSDYQDSSYEIDITANTTGYYYFSVSGYSTSYNFEVLRTNGSGGNPGEDELEPNDDFGSATPLTLDGDGNPIDQLTIDPAGEVDFYSIDLDQGDDINILLWNLPANYDLALFYPNQTLVSESTNTGTTDDEIDYENAEVSGAYYIRVSDSDYYAGVYNLRILLEEYTPPNNDFESAAPLTLDDDGKTTEQLTIDPAGEVDFYSIDLNQRDDIEILLWNLPANYDLALFYPNQTLVHESTNTGTTDDEIDYENAEISGTYYICVSDLDNYVGVYNLTIWLKSNISPNANFTVNSTIIDQGEWVFCTFIGALGDLPTEYLWNFGDGTVNITTQNSTHQYLSFGEFKITLIITDSDGETSTFVKTVIVRSSSRTSGYSSIFGLSLTVGFIYILFMFVKKERDGLRKKN